MNRQFQAPAPNRLWVSDFTYVATWRGFVYVSFVIDAYARRIVGWRVSGNATAGFVLDALEQAIHDRRPAKGAGLVARSDHGSQYLAIHYAERLAEAGIEPSVGSIANSYDNALAETVIGLFKTEVIRPRGPWRSLEAVEFDTLEWVDWLNVVRSHTPAHPARTHREHPARRGRGRIPRADGRHARGSITQTNQPPRNPGRFNPVVSWKWWRLRGGVISG